jgi:hypothetical protein
VSGAAFANKVEGYYGAPQTIYSDHFLDANALDGPIGFKLEAPPVAPDPRGITLPGFGSEHAQWMTRFPHVQCDRPACATVPRGGARRPVLLRDGLAGARLPDGDYLWNGVRRAYLAMAEIQFAAGAQR